MNSQQVLDRRKHLVDTGVIHEMNLGGINLGYEWSAMEPDQTDERVHQHMDRLARLSGDAGSPRIVLDLGCAHGARLQRYAQTGMECIGVDVIDTNDSILAANHALLAQQKPPIAYIHADIRALEAADFGGKQFAVINCSQVLHFMSKDDIIHMLQFIKAIAGPQTLICISLDTVDATTNSPFFREHVKMLWDERLQILGRMGYMPKDKLEYRIYSEVDITTIANKVGLHIHGTLGNQSGLLTMFASAASDALLDQRPNQRGMVVTLKDYFRAQF